MNSLLIQCADALPYIFLRQRERLFTYVARWAQSVKKNLLAYPCSLGTKGGKIYLLFFLQDIYKYARNARCTLERRVILQRGTREKRFGEVISDRREQRFAAEMRFY